MPQPSMAVESCARMVTAASHICPAPPSHSPAPEPHTFDALAASFGALSAGLTFGAIVIALLTVLVGFAWGRYIATEAKNEAVKAMRETVKEEVARVAKPIMDDWLTSEGVEQMRQLSQMTQSPSPTADANAADEIASRVEG